MKNTLALAFILSSLTHILSAQSTEEVIRCTFEYDGSERQYLVYLPNNYDPGKLYWPMVHARGAREDTLSMDLRSEANKRDFDAILIAPILRTESVATAFPALGEGAFLKQVISDARSKYRLHDKVLLTGYSGRGQFTHRFALQNPEWVEAAAPLAPRSWTTPDGSYLEFGENGEKPLVLAHEDVEPFLSSHGGEIGKPAAKVAGLKAKAGAEKIPFLVMCGKMDPRLEICNRFAKSLRDNGFYVETQWPNTEHAAGKAPENERIKYASYTVDFFQRMTAPDQAKQ